jgi:putative chitinase
MSLTKLQEKIGVTADGAFGPGTLKAACAHFKLNKNRAAHFFAQTAHESGNFKAFSENLNYGAKGLRGIFGKYFPTDALAKAYERQPQKIANRVYANRMGNGDEASGDGWRYRGRGLKQLTGKDNYTRCGQGLGLDLVANPDLLLTPEGASLSAAWFWSVNKCGPIADSGDFVALTKKINGGTIGLEDRQKRYKAVLAV